MPFDVLTFIGIAAIELVALVSVFRSIPKFWLRIVAASAVALIAAILRNVLFGSGINIGTTRMALIHAAFVAAIVALLCGLERSRKR